MTSIRKNQPAQRPLKFLTLAPGVADDSDSQMGDKTTSFEGFEIKTDPAIKKLQGQHWADIDDNTSANTTPFVTPSPFEIGVRNPGFPQGTPAQVSQRQLTSDDLIETQSTDSKPDEPTPLEVALKPTEAPEEGLDAFADDEVTPRATEEQRAPQHGGYTNQPYGPPAVESEMQQQFSTCSQDQQPQSQQYHMPMPQNMNAVANPELAGWLPFAHYNEMALNSELPTAAAVGAAHTYGVTRPSKFFFGHLWSKLPTGCLQWMINKFVSDDGSHCAYAPQLHFNREGWFRGCLHVSVFSHVPQEVLYRLHKRVLFDHTGVWYAETDEQAEILNEYCRRLRSMPQNLRHQKLQSLPCNPMACELASNEH